jgi:hypothetical protein
MNPEMGANSWHIQLLVPLQGHSQMFEELHDSWRELISGGWTQAGLKLPSDTPSQPHPWVPLEQTAIRHIDCTLGFGRGVLTEASLKSCCASYN